MSANQLKRNSVQKVVEEAKRLGLKNPKVDTERSWVSQNCVCDPAGDVGHSGGDIYLIADFEEDPHIEGLPWALKPGPLKIATSLEEALAGGSRNIFGTSWAGCRRCEYIPRINVILVKRETPQDPSQLAPRRRTGC